ncbi:MAG: DUF4271 domain-containing protein [Paludibacteraceae bacterium]|nr:DUF4271 domain-containing protein [Paludibacteraceae bacterium]
MPAVSHIVSPWTAPWCGWTMLLLVLFAALSEAMQRGVITQAMSSFTARTDRMYKDAPTNVLAQIFITFFRLGTLAMMLCLCLGPYDRFTFAMFGVVCAIIVGVLLLKMAVTALIDYTFMLSQRFGAVYEHYSNILTIISVVLYPLMLLFMHIGNQEATRWLLGITAVIYLLAWMYISARWFVQSPKAVLYLLLYFATVECLSIAALVFISAKTISLL